jgi:hypothetical protein
MKAPALNKIEVFELWQVAMYAGHGYHVKRYGHRFFMVRAVK